MNEIAQVSGHLCRGWVWVCYRGKNKNDYLARVQVERPYGWRSRPQRFSVVVQRLHNARVQDPQHILRIQVQVDGVLHIPRLTLFLYRQARVRRHDRLTTRVGRAQASRGHSGWHAGT